jgi:Rrf2 family protein
MVMRITSLEEYGMRCMVLLARTGTDKTLTLPDFKLKEGLSIPYAAKMLMILKRAGLVKAMRGRHGGYTLSRPAEKIVLKEIFDALGEPAFSPSHCERHTGLFEICVHESDCKVRDVWKTFGGFIDQILDRITLADVVDGKLGIMEAFQISSGNGGPPSNVAIPATVEVNSLNTIKRDK